MADDGKKRRKERIARVDQARKDAGMNPKKGIPEATYWMSRNLIDGVLSSMVDIWLIKPTRKKLGENYWWAAINEDARVLTTEGPKGPHIGARTLEACLWYARVYPDDSLQLIRVGNDEPRIATPEELT